MVNTADRRAAYNSTDPKGWVSSPFDSFVVNQTLVFQIKFCGKSPALRVAAKRCAQLMNMKRIEIFKDKLIELKKLDKRFSIFGSSDHKYELNPTLNEEEIKNIEKVNNIFLSEDYKHILMHLGNGGAGCGYGLESLNLKNMNPPYIGTDKLLRNWDDPKHIDFDMVNLDEISGYIKLFDYGCGIETCLIVNGEKKGGINIF